MKRRYIFLLACAVQNCTVHQEPISVGQVCPDVRDIGAPVPGSELLDDFEDGDLTVLANADRTGRWTLFQDDTDPTINLANSSECAARGARALRVETAGTRDWGAAAAVFFLADSSMTYDLSGYRGLSFWAADAAEGQGLALRFGLNTVDTAYGMGCTTCSDNYNTEVSLSSAWQRVDVEFAQLAQEGWGVPQKPLDLRRALSLVLWLSPRPIPNQPPVPGRPVELWIDDVRLTR